MTVHSGTTYAVFVALLYCGLHPAFSQSWSLHGQASGWVTSAPETSPLSQAGLRYIPDLMVEQTFEGGLKTDMDLSLNAFAAAHFARSERTSFEGTVEPYRLWLRFSTSAFEARVGLQRISFGSATLFRPLMWFDRIDPRDPLQLTKGVYGLLGRYYFLNNANIWLWGLYGNDETKGWELAPTKHRSVEYGGRAQTSLWTGELGFTYHHREVDLTELASLLQSPHDNFGPENRVALDGKWDIGIGAWFEFALKHQRTDLPGLEYRRQWTVGADYTFDVGNGLTAVTEYFRSENPDRVFDPANGIGFSALSLSYPLGVVDRLSGILYYDWTNHDWYRLITWQRTYDDWIVYLLAFWNPERIQLYQSPSGTNPFSGAGVQFMLTFNH